MFGIGWKHRVARKVMIELLHAEGIRWAGWYRDRNLIAQWNRIMGQHNVGAFNRDQRRAAKAAWDATYPDPDRKPRSKKSKAELTLSWQELESWLAR